jgi:hypothetical protein
VDLTNIPPSKCERELVLQHPFSKGIVSLDGWKYCQSVLHSTLLLGSNLSDSQYRRRCIFEHLFLGWSGEDLLPSCFAPRQSLSQLPSDSDGYRTVIINMRWLYVLHSWLHFLGRSLRQLRHSPGKQLLSM